MKKALQVVVALTLIASLAEALVLMRIRIDPWKLFALLESVALLLGSYVGLTYTVFVRQLRQWAVSSQVLAAALPFTMLVPYLIFGLGTRTFSFWALAKLSLYIAAPTALLMPDRLHAVQRLTVRDVLAMVALAVPVATGWLHGIWDWPQDLYVFRPIFCVLVGGYGFMVLRGLQDVGFRLICNRRDASAALLNLVAFALPAIPLGIALGFIRPHSAAGLGHAEGLGQVANFAFLSIGIYLTVAIPEEMLFRGVLQNLLVRTVRRGPQGLYGLLMASVVFGAAHLHHKPIPNWRYAILATLAGIFYGDVYRTRQRLCASALTHALVDAIWHVWF